MQNNTLRKYITIPLFVKLTLQKSSFSTYGGFSTSARFLD